MKLLKAFFRLCAIFPIPRGQQGVDPTGFNGLVGLISNANAYADALASTATAGTNVNITAAQVASGIVQLNAGASAQFTATLPATSAILGALGNAIPFDGSFTKIVYIVNNLTTFTGVLTAGDANTTVTGPGVGAALLGSNVTKAFAMQVLNSSNITFSAIGTMPL
jgi:hypothetical protein